MGSKWKRARDALGLHLCILAPAKSNERPTPNATVSTRSSSSDTALLGGARESIVGPVQSSEVSPGRLHLIKPSVRLSPLSLMFLCRIEWSVFMGLIIPLWGLPLTAWGYLHLQMCHCEVMLVCFSHP